MLSRASGKLLRKLTRNPENIFMDRCVRAPCVLRRRQSKGGCLSKRAKSCQLAHQGAWKRWVLKQGLNYVKSRIREAAAQARNPENIFMDRCVLSPCVLRRRQSRGGCLSKG